MEALATATKTVMQSFMPQKPSQLDLSTHPYYIRVDQPMMYDAKSVIKANAPATSYNQWLQAYNAAVPCQLISTKWMTAYTSLQYDFPYFTHDEDAWGCTSMFFPQASYSSSSYRYNTRIANLAWYQAVDWPAYGW